MNGRAGRRHEKEHRNMASIAQASTAQTTLLNPTSLDDAIVRSAETTLETIGRAREEIHTVIFGQENVVDLSLITILTCGHGLLVGVPGLAKTKLVETLGTVLGLDARRVQFTPDLMPSDILGAEVLDEGADRRILIETPGLEEHRATAVMNAEQLLSAQRLVRRLPVGDSVVEAILDLVRSARPGGEGDAAVTDKLLWGPG